MKRQKRKKERYYIENGPIRSADGIEFYVNTQWEKKSFQNVLELAKKLGKRAEDIHEIMLHEYKVRGTIKVGNSYREKIVRDRTKHVRLDSMKRLYLHPYAEQWLIDKLQEKGK
mgnify:CR=1 FL=1